jgi:hypothetical protein
VADWSVLTTRILIERPGAVVHNGMEVDHEKRSGALDDFNPTTDRSAPLSVGPVAVAAHGSDPRGHAAVPRIRLLGHVVDGPRHSPRRDVARIAVP